MTKAVSMGTHEIIHCEKFSVRVSVFSVYFSLLRHFTTISVIQIGDPGVRHE